MEKGENVFEKILNWITHLAVFLLPIFTMPDLSSELAKQASITATAGILLVTFLLYSSSKSSIIITASKFTLPLFFLSLASLTSFLFNGQKINAAPAILNFVSLFSIFLIISSLPDARRQSLSLLITLIISCTIIAISSLLKLPLFSKIPIIGSSSTSLLVESTLTNTIFIATGLISVIPLIIRLKKNRKAHIFLVSLVVILFAGLLSSLYHLKNTPPTILPYEVGWGTTINQISVNFPANFLLGEGPNSFERVFTRFKPPSINSTPFWRSRFAASSNELFNTVSETGIVGLASLALLFGALAKCAYKNLGEKIDFIESSLLIIPLGLSIVSLLVPFTESIFLLLFLITSLVSLWQKSNEQTSDYAISLLTLTKYSVEANNENPPESAKRRENLLPLILIIPMIIVTLLIDLFFVRVALADVAMNKSFKKLPENKSSEVYELQAQAIRLNPNNDVYHIAFSQTNLAIANSLAQKKNLSDQDRQNVSTFIRQSINEAKMATSICPDKAANWENLAGVYKALINFAQGADQWAISSYLEAVKFDPTNPALRLDLAGVYLLKQDYQSAADQLSIAISLKTDYANAYYNLGYALKGLGKNTEAKKQFEIARNLVCTVVRKDTNDCQKAQKELDEIQKLTTEKNSPIASSNLISSTSAQVKPKNPVEPLSKTATTSDSLKKALSPNVPPPNLGSPASTPKVNPATPTPTTPKATPSPTPSPSRTP